MLKILNLHFILSLISLLWLIGLTIFLWTYIRGKKKIQKEIKAQGLDVVLEKLSKNLNKMEIDIQELYKISDQLTKLTTQSITRVGIVRYNPFSNTGGDQSFSIALLNSQNNGLVISSLHSRNETRIYSKPIVSGQSKYHLSEEEYKAIKKAIQASESKT